MLLSRLELECFSLAYVEYYAWNSRCGFGRAHLLISMVYNNRTIVTLYFRDWYHRNALHFKIHHDDVIKWRHFPRNWPFVREITGPRWIPRTKASDAELWCFFICAWINRWVNNGEAGDLRRYRAHYDVIVMTFDITCCHRWCDVVHLN